MKLRIFFILVAIVIGWWLIYRYTTPAESKNYSVARDPSWNSLNLLNKTTDMLIFSDELLQEIAAKEDISFVTVSMVSDRLLTGLDNGEYDAVLTSITPTPNTFNNYALSDTYFYLGPVLIVANSSNIKSIYEMKDKSVGILRDASLVFDLEKIPYINLVTFDNPVVAIENLIKGTLDGVIMDILPAYTYTNKFYSGQIKIATPPLTKKGIKLITHQNSRGKLLIEKFNAGLAATKSDGSYQNLIEKWGLVNQ